MRVRWAFGVALLAFVGMAAGWALALPVNGTYDESEHIVRAYGVASGQVYATAGTQRVPASLLPGDPQCAWQRRLPASCQRPAATSRQLITVRTGAAGYSPVYYLPVGLPMLVSPGYRGIVAGRLVSALLCGLLLAAAAAVAVRAANRLLVGGLVLVATPMVMDLAGAVNPNGLEIAAGVLLWTSLLALVAAEGEPPRGVVALAGLGGALLMTVRHLGPVLVVLVLAAAALVAPPGRVRPLLRRRDVRRAGLVLAACGVLAVVWILTSGVTDVTPEPRNAHPYRPAQTLLLIAVLRVPFYVQQLVGRFSYGETTIPAWAEVAWYAAAAALCLPAVLLAGRRFRVAVAGLVLACLGILVALEFAFVHIAGWVAQGRYVMPAGVGVVLAAAAVPRWPAALGPAATNRLVRLVVAVAVPVHLWALAAVMTRFQLGPDALVHH